MSDNTQTQTQEQTVTINLQNSGDPELEHRIFSQVHGVGRQLGRVAAVVEALLAAHEADPGFVPSPDARAAIDSFKLMQADIAREKRRRDPAERLIEQLEALRKDDPQAFASLRGRLRFSPSRRIDGVFDICLKFDEENMDTKITSIICGGTDAPFDTYYTSARLYFGNNGRFSKLSGETCAGLNWPTNPGVYVVWNKSNTPADVLYIGMTGKFSNVGTMSANQGLKGRFNRWTPYIFDTKCNRFSYNPKYEKGESRDGPPKNGYSVNLPIAEICVDCFEYDTDFRMAPAFLEALLLQGYLMQYGRLPAGNNEF